MHYMGYVDNFKEPQRNANNGKNLQSLCSEVSLMSREVIYWHTGIK